MTRPDPRPYLDAAAASLSLPGQPAASLAALDAALAGAIGHKLFTVLAVNLAAGENQRFYSNMPVAYPVGGAKKLQTDNVGMRDIIDRGLCRINHDYAELSEAFYDHELIRSLGCESSVNVPVRWNGATLGTLNILHESGYYHESDLPTLRLFGALAVPALLEIIRDW